MSDSVQMTLIADRPTAGDAAGLGLSSEQDLAAAAWCSGGTLGARSSAGGPAQHSTLDHRGRHSDAAVRRAVRVDHEGPGSCSRLMTAC